MIRRVTAGDRRHFGNCRRSAFADRPRPDPEDLRDL